jgi:hypothetical protein
MFALPPPPPTRVPQESARAPKISGILPPATPLEAMMDQLEYLANHASGRVCPDNCWACVRLKEAEDLLLKPFRV